jgi:hypothetical protein
MDTSHAPPARQVNAWAQRRRRPTRAQKLAAAARAAADVRAYDTDPDVVALRIERLRTRVDRLIWTGLVLGLSFTMANVQQFASRGKTQTDIEWWIAWLLDPMVSLVLIGVLLGEQIIARHQIKGGRWIRRTKWTCLAATYAMNTWSSWAALNAADIVLHSVPPAIVFCAAEAVTTLKHQITAAVHKAYLWAAERTAAIDEASAEAVARAKAIADTNAAGPDAEEGTRALADLKAWAQRRVRGFDPAAPSTTSSTVDGVANRVDGRVDGGVNAGPSVMQIPAARQAASSTPLSTPVLTDERVDEAVDFDVYDNTMFDLERVLSGHASSTPLSTPSSTNDGVDEQVDEDVDEATKTKVMRAFWESEITQKRFPKPIELARHAAASRSLAARLRKAWVEELDGWDKRRAEAALRDKPSA